MQLGAERSPENRDRIGTGESLKRVADLVGPSAVFEAARHPQEGGVQVH